MNGLTLCIVNEGDTYAERCKIAADAVAGTLSLADAMTRWMRLVGRYARQYARLHDDHFSRAEQAESARELHAYYERDAREEARDVARAQHFARLNSYRDSSEYAAWMRSIGGEAPAGLPSLIGQHWEISEELYQDALEALPPLRWTGESFYMSEGVFADIYSRFSRTGGRFYCEFARLPQKIAA